MDTINPLLELAGLPRFDAIRAEHVSPAIETLLAEADRALALATSSAVPAAYDALSAVLDVATERLGRAWSAVGHLNAVADSAPLRATYTQTMPKVVDFYTRMGAHGPLFEKYRAVLDDPGSARLGTPRRRALTNLLRDFRLSGVELEGAAKARYAELQDRQAEVGQKFSEHVLDATDGYVYYASADELAGAPDDVVLAARNAAEAEGNDGHKLTLQFPRYFPVMQYAQNRALRERLYRANTTRASEFGPPALDNGPLIHELLALRREEAQLLGYESPADLSLATKMASSPAQVMTFLEDLAKRARPGALRDLVELREFARSELGLNDLQAWDLPFASQALKQQRYAFSEQEVKQYFTEPKVLEGLFHIIETVFEVRIRPDTAAVWHPTVRFFRIEKDPSKGHDPAAIDGAPTLVGQFYLDLFARVGKRPGAWMDDARDRWLRPEGPLQTPIAHLVCNFAPPVVVDGVERPALLTHDDVVTLFHEFGHGLQLMLTQIDDLGVSGISGVEWDAVELPSQFMENFCWEWDVIKCLTSHVDTGVPLPRSLFDRMLAAKNFHSGLDTLRQVELSMIDMRLHIDTDAPARVNQIVADVRAEVAVLTPPDFNRALNTFTHIFDGGYAAGYYSYKWAEVLSADAWSAFEETAGGTAGVLNVETGRRYRQAVLETGGSRSALESFTAFRGREPRIDALLRHQGLN